MAPSIPCEKDKRKEVGRQTVGLSKSAVHKGHRIAGIRRRGRQHRRTVQARTDISGTFSALFVAVNIEQESP